MMRNPYTTFVNTAAAFFFVFIGFAGTVAAYPPAVGIAGKATSCLACHADNGPWLGEEKVVIDILDKGTMTSLRQPDGTFLLEAERGARRTVITVSGWMNDGDVAPPEKNAWLYVDPTRIDTDSLSKFAPGWGVNLPMACRLIGDKLEGFEGAYITALPMKVQAFDGAGTTELVLQVMLTRGQGAKGNPNDGLVANYFERTVLLKVRD